MNYQEFGPGRGWQEAAPAQRPDDTTVTHWQVTPLTQPSPSFPGRQHRSWQVELGIERTLPRGWEEDWGRRQSGFGADTVSALLRQGKLEPVSPSAVANARFTYSLERDTHVRPVLDGDAIRQTVRGVVAVEYEKAAAGDLEQLKHYTRRQVMLALASATVDGVGAILNRSGAEEQYRSQLNFRPDGTPVYHRETLPPGSPRHAG